MLLVYSFKTVLKNLPHLRVANIPWCIILVMSLLHNIVRVWDDFFLFDSMFVILIYLLITRFHFHLSVLRNYVFGLGMTQLGLTVVLSRLCALLLSLNQLLIFLQPFTMYIHSFDNYRRRIPVKIALNWLNIFFVHNFPQLMIAFYLSTHSCVFNDFILILPPSIDLFFWTNLLVLSVTTRAIIIGFILLKLFWVFALCIRQGFLHRYKFFHIFLFIGLLHLSPSQHLPFTIVELLMKLTF